MTDPSSGPPGPHQPPGPSASGWPPPGQPYPGQPLPGPYHSGQRPPGPPYAGPAGGHPPPYPGPFPPGPYPMPPKRSGAGRTVPVVIAVAVLLLGLCCCGAFTYDGWYRPHQQQEQRLELADDLGVPAGFSSVRTEEYDQAVGVEYKIICERHVCPVDVAQSLQAWLANAGLRGVGVQDVRRCLIDPRGPTCGTMRWERDGFTMVAAVVGTLPRPGDGITFDTDITLSFSIGRHD